MAENLTAKKTTAKVSDKKEVKARPERPPLTRRRRLEGEIDKDPDRHYHWIHISEGDSSLIEEALRLGYRFEEGDAELGWDESCRLGSQEGSKINRPGGPGTRVYLMSIPKDLYEERQKAEQAEIDEIEKQMGYLPHGHAPAGGLRTSLGETGMVIERREIERR